jgi:bifunctional N-acetylglucosamine-1-phosphate-uridyltransferase/glucosamine-1-phosphate-acetyltransferase GlmU-like protein
MRRALIVPAAGRGSRLQASVPKVLVPVNGRPMLDHLVDRYRQHVDTVIVVAHPSFSEDVGRHLTRTALATPFHVVEQREPTGMLDAILLGASAVADADPDRVWITWCDQVGVLPATVRRMASAEETAPDPSLVIPTVLRKAPYIHFARSTQGRIAEVLQRREGDAMPEEGESDMGVFALSRRAYEMDLPEYASTATPGRATAERNFLPFIPWLASRRLVVTFPCTDQMEAIGINTPEELRRVEGWLRANTARNL